MDTNRVLFEGTISRMPEVWDSDGNKTPFMSLNIGIEERGIVSAESMTTYHRLKGFGKKLTNQASNLCTGAKVKLYGRLVTRSFERNGRKEYITEVVIDPGNFTILQACTEPEDEMADFNQEASDAAMAESRIDQEVNEENRTDPELNGSKVDGDGIPF